MPLRPPRVRRSTSWCRHGWRSSLRLPLKRIPLDRIRRADAAELRAGEWGGWGYRWVPWRRGSAAVMRAGSGFRFDFANGKVFVVTVDDVDAGLEIIRGVLATK